MVPTWNLPAPLLADDNGEAVKLVRQYVAKDDAQHGGVAFTGSMFDNWTGIAGAGDDPNQFTNNDITAVAFLSVQIPPRAVLELRRRRHEHSELLRAIPADLDLHDADHDQVDPNSAASELWEDLRTIHDIGWVTAGKLLARKRPRLLPVYDKVVREVLNMPEGAFWDCLHAALQERQGALATKLMAIRDEADTGHVTVLRVFDIVCWMEGRRLGVG